MDQKMMSEFISDTRISLKSLQMKKNGLRGVKLDTSSLIKFNSLEDFLPQLRSLKQRVSDDLKTKIPLVESLRKQHNDTYDKYNEVIRRKEKYNRELDELKRLCLEYKTTYSKVDQNQIALVEELRNAHKTLSEKKEELLQAWIPFYGLFIIGKLKRIENEEIPHLESKIAEYSRNIENYAPQKKELKVLINDISNKLEEKEKELFKTQEELNKYKKVIDSIHQDISQQVKNLTYLNILEEKVTLALSKGTVTHDVMHLLDLEPDIIHYDDENIYFDLIEKWAQTKDDKVLEEFYMNAEKDFFNKI